MLTPNHHLYSVTNVDTALTFVRGVPRTVTDEQAAKLLAVWDQPYFEGSEERVKELRELHGNPFIGKLNENVGKRKNPEFIEVATEAAPTAGTVSTFKTSSDSKNDDAQNGAAA